MWQRLQEAQSTLQKKREAEAKLLWANKPEKLQQAKDDINEVKLSTANDLLHNTLQVLYIRPTCSILVRVFC